MMDKNTAFCGVLFLFLSVIGFGQNERIMMANLKQDLELINREVTGLRSEVELLRRENAQLRVALEQVSRSPQSNQETGLILELQNRMQVLELALKQSERARESMQDGVNQKFKQMIEQMNLGFEQVTSQNKQKSVPPPPSFSTDYPKNGFVHKVEKGETVSSIAQKYQSKVSWIIDANQIADPTKVFVGRELFVPQK
jgi:LysM repeat protein